MYQRVRPERQGQQAVLKEGVPKGSGRVSAFSAVPPFSSILSRNVLYGTDRQLHACYRDFRKEGRGVLL